jgi:hypothetical protein
VPVEVAGGPVAFELPLPYGLSALLHAVLQVRQEEHHRLFYSLAIALQCLCAGLQRLPAHGGSRKASLRAAATPSTLEGGAM